MSKNSGKEKQRRSLDAYMKRLVQASGIEPPFSASQIGALIEAYRHLAVCDKRLFYFNIVHSVQGDKVRLRGEVSLGELKSGLLSLLEQGGLKDIEEDIRVLPDLAIRGHNLAVVNTPVAGVFLEPNIASEQISQMLIGDSVEILKRERSYCLVQGSDAYVGWTMTNTLCYCDAEQFQEWISLPRAAFVEPVRHGQTHIPLGAELPLVRRGTVLLPDTRTLAVPERSYRPLQYQQRPQREAVVRSAEVFLGTPYQWGGKSNQGIDCSGLVQMAYRGAGVYLSRDANQQLLAGRLVATRNYRAEMAPADLLFFASCIGNIGHVGISQGEGRFIHACDQGVVVSSLYPEDEEYDQKRAESFVYAKRVIQ